MGVSLFVLAGNVSVNASPTFQDSCFETEEKASEHQSNYESREVDTSKVWEIDKLATALIDRGGVKVSELEAILGKPEIETDEVTNITTYIWRIYFSGSPSAGEVSYDASRGYCVSTRRASFGAIRFTLEAEGFDKTQGIASRYVSSL